MAKENPVGNDKTISEGIGNAERKLFSLGIFIESRADASLAVGTRANVDGGRESIFGKYQKVHSPDVDWNLGGKGVQVIDGRGRDS